MKILDFVSKPGMSPEVRQITEDMAPNMAALAEYQARPYEERVKEAKDYFDDLRERIGWTDDTDGTVINESDITEDSVINDSSF